MDKPNTFIILCQLIDALAAEWPNDKAPPTLCITKNNRGAPPDQFTIEVERKDGLNNVVNGPSGSGSNIGEAVRDIAHKFAGTYKSEKLALVGMLQEDEKPTERKIPNDGVGGHGGYEWPTSMGKNER